MQMMYTLQQGNITVRVTLERESADRTYVTVVPVFEGIYQFAGNRATPQCISNGVLEKDLLRAAGANPAELNKLYSFAPSRRIPSNHGSFIQIQWTNPKMV
jgi:hypothetical protein